MPARQAAPIFISQPAMVAPPTLGKKVTAEQLQEFDEECKLYFHRNNVSNAAKVKHIAYAIAHPAVCKFYLANINRSHRMTYEAFLAQARRLILGPQWEKKIRCEMMLIYQGDDAFDGWYQSLSAMNNCIAGTLSFLDDDGLRVHLQAHAHVDLQEAIDTNDYDYEPDFALWIAADNKSSMTSGLRRSSANTRKPARDRRMPHPRPEPLQHRRLPRQIHHSKLTFRRSAMKNGCT